MTNKALPTLGTTGWTVAVVRNPNSGMTRELYDCAIPAFRDAEKAVLGKEFRFGVRRSQEEMIMAVRAMNRPA